MAHPKTCKTKRKRASADRNGLAQRINEGVTIVTGTKLNPTIDADTILGLISKFGGLCAAVEIHFADKAGHEARRKAANDAFMLLGQLIRHCAECGTPRYQMCSHYAGYAAELGRLNPARDIAMPSQADVATAVLSPDTQTADDHCAPYLNTDDGTWTIGDRPCVVRSSGYHATAEGAIAHHNLALAALVPAVDTISATPKRWKDNQGDTWEEFGELLRLVDDGEEAIWHSEKGREYVEKHFGPLTPVEPEAVDTISAARVEEHHPVSAYGCSCGWQVDGFTAPELHGVKLRTHIRGYQS